MRSPRSRTRSIAWRLGRILAIGLPLAVCLGAAEPSSSPPTGTPGAVAVGEANGRALDRLSNSQAAATPRTGETVVTAERHQRPETAPPAARRRIPGRDVRERLRRWSASATTVLPDRAGSTPAAFATSLASADFDEDGVADLVLGHGGATSSSLALHRGRERAVASRGIDPSATWPFHPPTRTFALPAPPDRLVAGDFDADGHQDVVSATIGRPRLHVLFGDGRGGFGPAEPVLLDGPLTALIAADVNRPDGLVDLVAGVSGEDRAAVLVFEGPAGAVRHDPERIPVPAPPTALLAARLSGGPSRDLAIAAGDEILVVAGRDRQRVLPAELREDTGAPRAIPISRTGPVRAMAWGDFAWEAVPRRELALLLDDGSIQLLDRDVSPGAVRSPATWTTVGRRASGRPTIRGSASTSAAAQLLSLRLTGSATEELAILDGARGATVLSGMVRGSGGGSLADPGLAVAPAVGGRPLSAALPMRLNTDALSDLVVLSVDGLPGVLNSAPQAVITVDSAADSLVAGDGACTLREAIGNANSDSDTTAGDCAAGAGVDSIAFNISGGGAPQLIAVTSALPALTDAVTVDGTTQSCPRRACIVLDGSGAGPVAAGLAVTASSSTIRGLVVNQFAGVDGDPDFNAFGIHLTSSGNVVESNLIGTDISGTVGQGNDGAGVRIENGSNNTIGGTAPAAGNLVSAAVIGRGITLVGSSEDNEILGNHIGTDLDGLADLGNAGSGVGGASSNNIIGGTMAGARNVISGNEANGVFLPSPAQGNLVLGNYVGIDATGFSALGNGINFSSVWIDGTGNTVGGTSVAARNVIAGNPANGVRLTSSGHLVLGNHIGTTADGGSALGNTGVGVRIQDGQNNTVGGVVPGARNVISGNGSDGVFIGGASSQGNSILGNHIGTDAAGATALGNGLVGVEIDGAAFSNKIGAPGAGNVISGNLQGGLFIQLGQQNVVEGNLIGTDALGTSAVPNQGFSGVEVWDSDNTIGGLTPGAGNVISGNEISGVFFTGLGAHDNRVLGNLIGTDVTGATGLGNVLNGVEFQNASGNFVGGDMPGARNVISGNDLNGIHMNGSSSNTVRGNRIGTDAGGTYAIGNGLAGVRVIDSTDVTIGGADPAARNVISGNETVGVRIAGTAQNNVVEGNYIGTDVSGGVAVANLLAGVEIESGSRNTIGGTAPGAGNVISGNGDVQGWGVVLEATSLNLVLGNLIGTTADGTGPLRNRLAGVATAGGSANNAIGGRGVTPGRCDGPCNRIGYNGDGSLNDGVRILSGSGAGNAVLGNSIHSSGELGIDLEGSGVTPNDSGDADTGGNDQQNFPVLNLADATPSDITVGGSLDSTPDSTFRLEFFANAGCDGSGYGEGTRYLGFTDVATDATGTAGFSVSLTGPVSHGEAVTATATNAADSTSEYSACFPATCLLTAGFGQSIVAPDGSRLSWPVPSDVRFVKGDLAGVGLYAIANSGDVPGATELDLSVDTPAAGEGLFYLVRNLACGSWQTAPAAEPGRDAGLP